MFGNVNDSGDLDVDDYLDEDAKEHLAALADKLGSSLAGPNGRSIRVLCLSAFQLRTHENQRKLPELDCPASQSQQKPVVKKTIPKVPTRITIVEATEDLNSKPTMKVQKIVISSKMKPADGQLEPYKASVETPRTSIVFRSLGDSDKAQGEVNKPSEVIKPPADRVT
ncbi:hypothetical protein MLD38_023226 [Melastoma candidum]|uniref:Uncharacterized protein n=1 Tax=Melastoma candidum TaxID=119954 RepID=A0ACB9QV07_9MYRT|nr:hypothetical protein MLD38_023226 [Melastoma candidum]